MKMGQLFDNSFTLRYCSLKLSLSLHKQIKSAAFEGQDRYCIISSDWCIISSVVTVLLAFVKEFRTKIGGIQREKTDYCGKLPSSERNLISMVERE